MTPAPPLTVPGSMEKLDPEALEAARVAYVRLGASFEGAISAYLAAARRSPPAVEPGGLEAVSYEALVFQQNAGYAAGVRDAAKVADDQSHGHCAVYVRRLAAAIRALAITRQGLTNAAVEPGSPLSAAGVGEPTLRTALKDARKAIASLEPYALGGASQEDGYGGTQQWPLRDELLANIDLALRTGSAGTFAAGVEASVKAGKAASTGADNAD